MAIAASSHLAAFVAWQFLPSILSTLLLNTFYRLFPARRPTVPPNAPPAQLAYENGRATKHAQRARIALVAAYLGYTLVSAYWAQQQGFAQNYYSLLGLPRAVVEAEGERAVKSHWRKLARVYHPDKVGSQGEELFVALRRATETLENEHKRWAYERWGPEVADWGRLATQREYILRGAQQTAVFWAFAVVSVFVLGLFRKDERANKFWRYFMLILALATETHLTLHGHSTTLDSIFPARLAYEHISLVRQSFLSFSMAVSQLAPLLFPPAEEDDGAAGGDKDFVRAHREASALRPAMSRLAGLIKEAEREVVGLQSLELRPLLESVVDGQVGEEVDPGRVVAGLKRRMEYTFHDINLKQNPATSSIWTHAVREGKKVKMEEDDEVFVRLADPPLAAKNGSAGDALAASRLPTPPPEL